MNLESVYLSDGGVIIGRSTMYDDGGLTKFDSQGDLVWSNTYSDGFSNYPFDKISEASDGSIYNTYGLNGISVSKLTALGNTVWNNSYSFPSSSSYPDIASASDGLDLICFGVSSSDSAFILKIDGSGTLLFSKRLKLSSVLTTAGSNRINKMIRTSSGDFIVVGKTQDTFSATINNFIIKIDGNGNVIWGQKIDEGIDGVFNLDLHSVKETSSGDLILAGVSTKNGKTGSTIIRLASNGSVLSGMQYQDNSNKTFITELSTGELIITSTSMDLSEGGILKNGVMKTNSLGNVEWTRAFGSFDQNYAIETNIGNSDTIYIQGAFAEFMDPIKYYLASIDLQGRSEGCYDIVATVIETTLSLTLSSFTGTLSNEVVNVFPYSMTVASEVVSPFSFEFQTAGTVNNPLCNEEFGAVDLTITGGSAPYSFSWSNGTNSQNLLNAPAGNYSVRIVDNQGCVKLDTFDIVEPSEVTVTSVISHVTCFGSQNGSIDVTSTGGTPGYSYLWATQDITEDVSGLSGGFYQVTIIDANGCDEDFGFAISEPQQLFAAITSSQNVSCYSACDGSLSGLASGGTSPNVLGWNDPNNTVGSSVSNLCPGNYLFTITDNNGCVSYSNGTITEPLPISSSTASAGSECDVANGEASIDVIGGTMPYAYSWTSGDVAETAINLIPGSYDVTVTDNNGCIINESVIVNTLTTPVEICVITVDSVDNKNMIIWEKPVTLNIQGFYIYRNIAGAYSQVGYQPYDSISQFVDNSFGVDPAVTSYRYEISVLDSCGNESDLSSFHETIHLTSNLGLNDEVNLIWDDYEGFVFTQYNILRDSTGNGNWEQIANVANTSFTYTDLTPPQSSSLRYLVEVVLPFTCSATKAQDHNTTRSNRATIAAPNANSLEELILSQASVYPNPSKGIFTINVKSDNWNYSLYDMSGKIISTEMVSETNKQIDIQTLETGIYLMKINLGDSSIFKKVIKQ